MLPRTAERGIRRYIRSVRRLWNWVTESYPYRVWLTFRDAGGNLLAAGMSYQLLFAVFAGVWVLFAVANNLFSTRPTLRDAVINIINSQVPGLIDDNGPIFPAMLEQHSSMTISAVIALVATLFTAVTWLAYARVAMRRIFDLPAITRVPFPFLKAHDLLIAVIYGVLIIASGIASVIMTRTIDSIMTLFGLTNTDPRTVELLRALGVVIVFSIDTVMLALFIRIMSGLLIPWRRLFMGSVLGGIALGLFKIAATLYIGEASNNPLLASVALFIGLLVWFNLSSRVILLSAAWIATGLADRKVSPRDIGWIFHRGTQPHGRRPRQELRT